MWLLASRRNSNAKRLRVNSAPHRVFKTLVSWSRDGVIVTLRSAPIVRGEAHQIQVRDRGWLRVLSLITHEEGSING